MSNAENQRRYRQRQKDGIQVVRLDVGYTLIERLLADGFLSPDDALDSGKLAEAILKKTVTPYSGTDPATATIAPTLATG